MSQTTKRALEASLKKLLLQKPLNKITINDITEDCGVNRMTFYYHFKDKFDLVNWIYDVEYLSHVQIGENLIGWDSVLHLCDYFYENKDIGAQIQELSEKNCQGILLLGTEMDVEYFQPFTRLKVPMVVLDTYFEELDCDSVLINNVQGAYLATNYLIDKGLGEIGYLRSSYPIGNFEERADGYYKALRHHDLPTSHPYVHRLTPSMEGAYTDMSEILREKPPVAPAYFADNDLIAAGAMRAFKEFGYKIPEDISIVGFDDTPICDFLEPPLTTMEVPKKRLGELAVLRLLQKIAGETKVMIKTEVSVKLHERKSVKG